jgi:phage terminase large subunit
VSASTLQDQARLRSAISCFTEKKKLLRGPEVRQKTYDQPEWYLTQVLGISPWPKQVEILESVKVNEKTICFSCVASGKSYIGGAAIPWWLTAFYPARVFIIAPTERQIKINIWGEFSKVYFGSRIPLGGELLTLDYKLGDNWYAKGFSPKDALGVFGFHGPHDLVIFDDSQGISLDVFDAFENASAAGTARYLLLCNPAVVSGYVYDAIVGRKKMHRIKIDAWDTPNVRTGQVIVPGLLTKEKVDAWIEEYGYDSDFVRVKVRALTPKQEPDTLIPIDWVEQARTRDVQLMGVPEAVIGVDVGRFGDDKSVILVRVERKVVLIVRLHGNDTMQVAGKVAEVADQFPRHDIYIDEIGIGSGVLDRLKEQKRQNGLPRYNVHGVNVGTKPNDEEKFIIRRDEMWWSARQSLDPTNPAAVCLSDEIPEELLDSLEADLCAMKWTIQSDKKIVIEKKDKTKERLGRSTDFGDAYCLAVFRDYTTAARPSFTFVNKPGLTRRPSWLR